jgi:hypothetical protein
MHSWLLTVHHQEGKDDRKFREDKRQDKVTD